MMFFKWCFNHLLYFSFNPIRRLSTSFMRDFKYLSCWLFIWTNDFGRICSLNSDWWSFLALKFSPSISSKSPSSSSDFEDFYDLEDLVFCDIFYWSSLSCFFYSAALSSFYYWRSSFSLLNLISLSYISFLFCSSSFF